MMKLVNRLLVIAVIAFGSWFLVQQWDKVEGGKVLETEVTEVALDGEERVNEDDILVVFDDVDPAEKPIRRVQPVTKVAPANAVPATKLTLATKLTPATRVATPVATTTVTDITVYLYEGGFDLSNFTASAGTINFNVRNDGRMSHEFAVEGIEDFGRVVPGESKTFTLTLRAGEYELFSPRAVDQTLDMRETLTVENAK